HSALIEIYRERGDNGKSTEARSRSRQLAQQIISTYAQQGEWQYRAHRLIYMLDQNIATYGIPRE
ncbi:MAG TPA: hypothetical protein VM056_06470, partial [Terriglobales bacterium]|nr:hypothetical protein [Terriglobales bacterium]